jgi:hypothetical protein
MLKDNEPPKETAEQIASRKWRNNSISRRFLEEKRKPKIVEVRSEPEIAETIKNEGRRDGAIRRFESKFKKELMALLHSHNEQNLTFYAASLAHQKRSLLLEKLRRLEARQNHDLFGPIGG